MGCPGQDRRYWTEDAVFEVPCPECGAAVEFFKDETSGRCPQCGHRFRNPGMDFGCASWCALAEQCLGFVPEGTQTGGSAGGALAGRLIQQLGERFKDAPTRMIAALKAFHHAKGLVPKEHAKPRTSLAAALLAELVRDRPIAQPLDPAAQKPEFEHMLEEAGADEQTIAEVGRIVQALQTGEKLDSAEFAVVHDAVCLARLTTECSPGEREKLAEAVANGLITEAAKQAARDWCHAEGQRPSGG